MVLLLPTALPVLSVLPLHSPPKTFSFQRPSHKSHYRRRHPLPIPIRPRAVLSSSSKEERVLSIRAVLRTHGIPEDACTAILSSCPDGVLHMKPLKNLDPKLQFLRSSVGLSGVEVAEILLFNPFILRVSLHPTLSWSVTFLSSVLPSNKDLVKVLRSMGAPRPAHMRANLQVLHDRDVPKSAIRTILLGYSRFLRRATASVVDAVETTEKLGLRPTCKNFPYSVIVACRLSKENFSRRLELLKELGWSEEQVYSMYRRRPQIIAVPGASIRKKVEYFKEVLGWGPKVFLSNPNILMLSLEERINPRCAVLNILLMKGLLEKNKKTLCPWRFVKAKRIFFADYVDKYREKVPEVLAAYQGSIEFRGWGVLMGVQQVEEEEEEEEEEEVTKSS